MKDFKRMLVMIIVIILLIAISLFAEKSDFNQEKKDLIGKVITVAQIDAFPTNSLIKADDGRYLKDGAVFYKVKDGNTLSPGTITSAQLLGKCAKECTIVGYLKSGQQVLQVGKVYHFNQISDQLSSSSATINYNYKLNEAVSGDVLIIGSETYIKRKGGWVKSDNENDDENKPRINDAEVDILIKSNCKNRNQCSLNSKDLVTVTTVPAESPKLVSVDDAQQSPSHINNDGSVTFKSADGKQIFIVPAGQSDVFICNDDKCEKPTKCSRCKFEKKDGMHTFLNNGEEVETDLDEDETPEIIREKNEDFCTKENNMDQGQCQYVKQNLISAVNIATAPFRAEIERIISPYINSLLDEMWIGSNRNFIMAWCGAKYYEKEGSQIQAFGSISDSWKAPNTFGVQDPVDVVYNGLLSGENNIIKMSGTKEEITPEMYRYSGRVQLLGNMQYRVYFYNSCTKQSSLFEGGFVKEGQLSATGQPNYDIQQYNDYFAGAATTFNCKTGACRFNQLCARTIKTINNEDQKEEETCVTLAKKKFLTPFKDGKASKDGSVDC
ncbi:hypothetical protein HZA96_01485 [Candidatus Woesearchaeota archaeon]|nr:hypothetical protein [Candidatus Woesearchaeota archaeon]